MSTGNRVITGQLPHDARLLICLFSLAQLVSQTRKQVKAGRITSVRLYLTFPVQHGGVLLLIFVYHRFVTFLGESIDNARL